MKFPTTLQFRYSPLRTLICWTVYRLPLALLAVLIVSPNRRDVALSPRPAPLPADCLYTSHHLSPRYESFWSRSLSFSLSLPRAQSVRRGQVVVISLVRSQNSLYTLVISRSMLSRYLSLQRLAGRCSKSEAACMQFARVRLPFSETWGESLGPSPICSVKLAASLSCLQTIAFQASG